MAYGTRSTRAPGVPFWEDLIGVPFMSGARGPNAFDCFGLVAEMSRRAGKPIPERISPTGDEGMAFLLAAQIPLCDELPGPTPGAIVAIRIGRYVRHVGFMVNRSEMLHAWEKTGGVTKEPLSVWGNRIVGFYQYK